MAGMSAAGSDCLFCRLIVGELPTDVVAETNRTFAYVAALAAGLALGRLAPREWSAMLAGVMIAAIVICGWSLL